MLVLLIQEGENNITNYIIIGKHPAVKVCNSLSPQWTQSRQHATRTTRTTVYNNIVL